jgi:hypothetical protein
MLAIQLVTLGTTLFDFPALSQNSFMTRIKASKVLSSNSLGTHLKDHEIERIDNLEGEQMKKIMFERLRLQSQERLQN